MECKNCNACKLGFFKSKPSSYVCTGVKEPFVINNINQVCTEYENKQDNNIGGAELTIGIKLNGWDNREYLDVITELQDKIIGTIEKLGHKFLVASSKPIDNSELE